MSVRVTKRVPKSCFDCYRRRVKCNKQIPCDVCIKRGVADTCRREKVMVDGKIFNEDTEVGYLGKLEFDFEMIKKENEYLKAKVSSYENPEQRAEPVSKISEYGYFGTTVGLITRFQAPVHNNVQYNMEDFEKLGDLLTFDVSRLLIDFNVENVYFLHCVILPEIFAKEHDDFFATTSIVVNGKFDKTRDQYLWLSTYYALIANSFLLLDGPTTRAINVTESEATDFGRIAFYCALECLNRGQYMQYPNIRSIQTFGILETCMYFFGVDLQNSLFFSMLYIARCLNLDKLVRPTEDLNLLNFEISCRVWWLLVVLDWFEDCTLNKPNAVELGSFTTPMPRNLSDFNLTHGIEQETNEFLPITYNLIIYDLSKFKKMYYFNNKITADENSQQHLDYAYMNILALEKNLATYEHYQDNTRFGRFLIDVKLNHEKLTVERSIINMKYNRNEDTQKETDICYRCSMQLIELFNNPNYPEFYKKYWFVIEHATNGSIFLLINIIMNEKSINLRTINSIEIFVKKLNQVELLENNPVVNGIIIINKLIETIKNKLDNEHYRLDIEEIDDVLKVLNDFQVIYKTENTPFNEDYWNDFFSWMYEEEQEHLKGHH